MRSSEHTHEPGSDYCSPCARRVRGVRPPLARKVAFGVGLAVVALVLCAAPFLGFALVFFAPILASVGMGLGPLAEAAFQPATCPDCGREVEAAARANAVRRAGSISPAAGVR